MALALLMHPWCAHHRITLTTLTVDHQLREGSAEEAQRVAGWMQARGIAHHILTPTADTRIRNTQARARQMRYAAMHAWCCAHRATHLLLAHHYDDQVETVALQQHRGESPPSRSGMALCRTQDGVRLVRPLLGVRKHALVQYLQQCAQPWAEDPSNASTAYARNRLRGTLPEMEHAWQQAQCMGAQRHRDDQQRNAWFMQHATNGIDLAAWRMLDAPLRQDYLSRAIQRIGSKEHRPRRHESARLAARVATKAAGKATLGHCLVQWNNGRLHIRPEHPLEAAASGPYIDLPNAPNALVSEPFWWFNHAPYNDGATRAPA